MSNEGESNSTKAVDLRFIEQEHRLFHTIANLVRYRKGPEDYRRASILSFGWAIAARASQTAAAGGVGVIALLGLLAAFRANELLAVQNQKMDQQTLLIDAQRRASLNVEMSSIWDQIRSETGTTGRRSAADATSPLLVARLVYISRAFQPYFTVRATAIIPVSKSQPLEASWWKRTPLSAPLPLSEYPLSPERGQLLVALDLAGIDLTTISSRGATFAYADLENQNLSLEELASVDLYRASFRNSYIFNSDFSAANLVETNFECAAFEGVHFGFGGGTIIVDRPIFRYADLGNFHVGPTDEVRSGNGGGLFYDEIHQAVFADFDLTDAFLDGLQIERSAVGDLPKSFDRRRYRLEALGSTTMIVKARDEALEQKRREDAEKECGASQRPPMDIRVGRNLRS